MAHNRKPASEQDKPPLYPEFWLIETQSTCYTASTVTARMLQRALGRWPQPRWISIVDLAGARVLLRSDTVVSLEQSSPETRSLRRLFRRERDEENSAEAFGP